MARRPRFAIAHALLLSLSAAAACSPEAPPAANSNAAGPAAPAAPSDPDAPQRVTFTTADDAGVAIVGDLYLPDESPAPAVLALHQWKADRSTYRDFGRAMRDAGFVVLAIDARGFGESTRGEAGTVEPSWDTTDDVEAAVDYLKDQPSVDALRIGIVGASYGASNALIYAAGDPEDVRSVALLSVGLNYNDSLPAEPAIREYGDRPLLMLAARDDAESAAGTEKLAAAAKSSRHRTQVYDAGGHGTALLSPPASALDAVKAFFVRTLTGPIAGPKGGAGEGPAENDNSSGDGG